MKWINAEQQVTVIIYDEEHEEHHDKIMTVEEMLDTYTNEGCPTMYSNPERKKGKWIICDNQRQEDINNGNYMYTCTNCLRSDVHAKTQKVPYCWWCGAKMEIEEEDEEEDE